MQVRVLKMSKTSNGSIFLSPIILLIFMKNVFLPKFEMPLYCISYVGKI